MSTATRRTLLMPRLGETMDQGTIAQWLVKPGDVFGRGDDLLELETDKTVVEYPALGAGRLIEVLAEPGDLVVVGAPIAVIETDDAWQGLKEETPEPEPSATEPAPNHAAAASGATPAASARPSAGSAPDKVRATPKARSLARERGLDVASLIGSGRRGRVEVHDVPSAQSATAPAARAGLADLLLIHGLGGMGSNWAAVRTVLADRPAKVTAPDLPGHGISASDSPGIDDLIAWVVAQLDAGDDALHLVGHSLGAHVAALAAAQRPAKIAALTMLAPVGCGADINGRFVTGMAAATTAGELRHLLRIVGPQAAALSDTAVASMAKSNERGLLTRLAGELARGDNQRVDTIAALAASPPTIPVRAVFGAADMVVPRDHIFNMPPRVACHVVRTGHMPHWDAPRLIADLISGV
ncbi:MAG: alpha/beta fold hydrolase [Pseudomonadota bacterium]